MNLEAALIALIAWITKIPHDNLLNVLRLLIAALIVYAVFWKAH